MSDCTLRNEQSPTPCRDSKADPFAHGFSDRRQSSNGSDITVLNPDNDVLVVDWDGPDDPSNPKNWSFKKKWGATAIVSAFAFVGPVSSSMVAPAINQVAAEFAVTSDAVVAMTVSVFILAHAFGPLVLGPLSELYGRSRVLQAANMWYLVWNLGCGFAQNTGQLIAFRFLAGLGGSASLSICGGVISDTWRPEERGMAMGLYSLAPFLGPSIGPITGAWVAEKSTWRWVFWATTAFAGLVGVLGFLYLKETYPPVLLEYKAKAIRKTLGDQEKGCKPQEVRTAYTSADRHWKAIFRETLTRPVVLFVREPIIQVTGLYMMFVYGLLYIFLTVMPTIFRRVYGERPGIAGLNYIAMGVGITGASQAFAFYSDRLYAKLKQRYGTGKPEYQLLALFPSSVILPTGLLVTGWAVEYKAHWIYADIGIILIGSGTVLAAQGILVYIIDSYALHAASALAALTFLRSFAGFGFPLFAPGMFRSLGYGPGCTVLAGIAIAIGVPAPVLFWKFGERIRNASTYSVKTPPPQKPNVS